MSAFFGHPALALLARRKLRGTARRMLRRVRTLKGAFFTLVGAGLLVMWIGSILFSSSRGAAVVPDPARLMPKVQLGALVLVLLNLASALQHRGLFLPKDEIERLFSAPIRSSDLIRYRMLATAGRSLFGGVIIGFAVMRHMPVPHLALGGIFLGVMTIPLLHQCTAILAGGIESRFARHLRVVARVGFVLLLVLGGFLLLAITWSGGIADAPIFRSLAERILGGEQEDLFAHPVVRGAILPFLPWGAMITATSHVEFLVWFLVCGGIWLALFEFTARLPLDFRELSLETSAHVAARLRRASRGGGAASGKASARMAGWRIPWFFGRGAGGAVAWRKTGSILRKARGTLWTSTAILFFLTIFSTALAETDLESFAILLPYAVISFFGTIYMCSGLRFDFRDELERMEVIKTWPVPPTRLFTAMLLPEVALVSVLLTGAIVLRLAISGWDFHPGIAFLVVVQPLLVLAWVGLDNAVFLFAPVRFTPGQDGALQNAGRGVLMMLLRMVVLAVIVVVASGTTWGLYFLVEGPLGFGPDVALGAGAVGGWCTLLAGDLAVLRLGGITLERFDVARDRG